MRKSPVFATVFAAMFVTACASVAQDKSMSFFITSVNPGQGGNLGGVAGADAHCQKLAAAAGAGKKTWHAYVSTENPPVNARDRIGKGPWYNAKGVMIAANLDELHGANKLTKETNLTEKGAIVNGYGDTPNTHDIMTGSMPDGRVAAGATCNDWTASSGSTTMLGHSDRRGTNPDPVANMSWNSSHKARGCSMPDLASTGSAGLLYCFAVR
jgi:hypothetical protein